jgi:hypothetical protein
MLTAKHFRGAQICTYLQPTQTPTLRNNTVEKIKKVLYYTLSKNVRFANKRTLNPHVHFTHLHYINIKTCEGIEV